MSRSETGVASAKKKLAAGSRSGMAVVLELLEERAPSKELGEYLADLRRRYGDVRKTASFPKFIRAYLP